MTDVGLSTGQPETTLDPRTGRQIVVVRPMGTGGRSAPKDPWAAAGFTTEAPKVSRETTSHGGDPWAAAGFTAEAPAPAAPVSTGHAALRGAAQGLTFGLAPALEGVAVAFEGGSDARAKYDKARSEAQADLEASREQHPWATTGGEFAGSALIPIPGGMVGSLAARTARGAVTGALNAGAYGAGSAISEGKDIPDVVRAAARSAAVGAPLGGTLGAVLGRAARTGQTAGERAARTAEDLGAPLPRGLASDNRMIQATTAKLRSVPFAGERIGERVQHTAEAAGHRIGDIAEGMTGGAVDRAAADVAIRPGLQGVIDANRQAIDRSYDALRNQLQGRHYTMPATNAALNAIMRARQAAGHTNPAQGLDQFRNLAGGATFNGAHRARVDAREAGNVLVPHPGYNRADFNRLTRAMTTDLRQMVQADAIRSPQQAIAAFDRAEQQFGRLAEQNNILHRLVNAQGEGAIATLLGAAREKGGNLPLLAQLRNSMPPAEFAQVGGTLLHELGRNAASGEFSLAQFVTGWNRVSDRAKGVLFSPQHLQDINNIAQLGQHVKGSLTFSNTSHTASVLVLLDLAKDAALLGADMASGGLGAGAAIGAGSSAAIWMLTRWLGNPAQARTMSNWTRAFQAVTLSQTPARIAAFRLATRNLSTNLGIPVEKIAKAITGPGAGRADEQQQ